MPDQQSQQSEQFDADIAGQKLSIRSQSLNTIATIATLVVTVLIAYMLFGHGTDTREASRELAAALKDMTQAAREQNCLITLPPERREQNTELCKRISR